MRFRVLMVATALAVAGLMAAMAYNVATINSPATAAVVSTDSALLALSCKPNTEAGNKDDTCSVKDGVLFLNFEKGLEGDFGFQPNSEYEFNELVIITNNSSELLDIEVIGDGELFDTDGLTVTMTPDFSSPVELESGQSLSITFKFKVAGDAELTEENLTADIKVQATAK